MTSVTVEQPARDARQVLLDAGRVTGPAMRAAIDLLPERVRCLAELHFDWSGTDEPVGRKGAGKAMRPALVLLACDVVGGARPAAVPAAVAVELVHNGSLLHDDIIDRDRLRRGRPALWATQGRPAGILAGDALFFLAVQVLNTSAAPLDTAGMRCLITWVQQLLEGEWADTPLEQQSAVSVAECSAVAAAKTASLTAAACELGALAGGADAERTAHLRAFGTHLGLAYQMADDLLGIWGDPRRTGKPVGSDLTWRKKSLPVAAALASGTTAGETLARLYCDGTEPLTADEVRRATELVEEANGCTWTVREAERHIGLALDHLAAAGPDPVPAAELAALARLITHRDH
ncbi:dimethylallyltransferase [Streptomyces longispororuber]|uniref:Dimethylallyltransferase n=1 Tax=Streptomyces longispororuber TaxID=68230 RepID=A0A918ZZZ1_9ACTN|nr:polyprenyl synthetase family protein [Streptomyces longispororuber]GHE79082.1 dimethylallyltransferase [Streptomyces longispororuber]